MKNIVLFFFDLVIVCFSNSNTKADNVFDSIVPLNITIVVYDTLNQGTISIDGQQTNTAVYTLADDPLVQLSAISNNPKQFLFHKWQIDQDDQLFFHHINYYDSQLSIQLKADGSGILNTEFGYKDSIEIYVSFGNPNECNSYLPFLDKKYTSKYWVTEGDQGVADGLLSASSMVQDMLAGVPTFDYTIGGRPDESHWPWAQAVAYLGMDTIYNTDGSIEYYNGFPGLKAVELTYSSDHALVVKLPSVTVLDNSGSAHQTIIPAVDSLTTIRLYLNEFKVAKWDLDPVRQSIKLIPDSVTGIVFSPDENTLNMPDGISGQMVIAHIGLCGMKGVEKPLLDPVYVDQYEDGYVDTNIIRQSIGIDGTTVSNGPFSIKEENGHLEIKSNGHDEWDYPIIKFPDPINMARSGITDTIFVRAKVLPGSIGNPTMAFFPVDTGNNAVSNQYDGFMLPGNHFALTEEYQVFKYVVKSWSAEYTTPNHVDSTSISALRLPINMGFASWPFANSGGQTVDRSFVGTIHIDYIQIGGKETKDWCTPQHINIPNIENVATAIKHFRINVVSSSGLPVSLSILEGPASISGDSVLLTGSPGYVSIAASQTGDETFCSAQQEIINFYIYESEDTLYNKKDTTVSVHGIIDLGAIDTCFIDYLKPIDQAYILNVSYSDSDITFNWVFIQEGQFTIISKSANKDLFRNGFYAIFLTINCNNAHKKSIRTHTFEDVYDVIANIELDADNEKPLRIFPNPASDHINLYLHETSGVEMFDLNGNMLFRTEKNKGLHQIDVTTISSGIYFIKVIGKSKTSNRKFLVK